MVTDNNGYVRHEHSSLLHRQIAYHEIYRPNRDKYPLPFSKYIVHHIDGNKANNSIGNLALMSKEEHNKIHGIATFDYEKDKKILLWILIIVVTTPIWFSLLIYLIKLFFYN